MPAGKMASQVAHAATAYLTRRIRWSAKFHEYYLIGMPLKFDGYIDKPTRKKVVVGVENQQDLYDLYLKAEKRGIEAHLIWDEGFTVFNNVLTLVCLAIGPDYDHEIDQITGHLETI